MADRASDPSPDPRRDPAEVLTRWAPPPATTVRYGELPDHVADVWFPEPAGPEPTELAEQASELGPGLVIVIHGGFWRAHFTRREVRPMCAALAAGGYVVAATEYRRTGEVGGGWPGTLDDIRAGLEALPGLVAATFTSAGTPASAGSPVGGGGLGGTRLIGHSAGGHLALWAGSQVQVPGLAGVVSLGGVCDLVSADELGLGAQGDRGAVDALLGGSSTEQPERYAAADPMQLPPPGVPVTLIHGTEDRIVPIELSRRYAAYAATAGSRATLVELPGIEHFGPIDPLSPAWPAVLAALR